jgi:hypothetical protein
MTVSLHRILRLDISSFLGSSRAIGVSVIGLPDAVPIHLFDII